MVSGSRRENDITRTTYDKTAASWTERYFDFTRMARQYADFEPLLRPGSLILDVGSGPGRDARYFTEKGHKVIGIDYSDGMIKQAQLLVPEVTYAKMDMTALGFRDATFDALWVCGSLHHIPKTEAETSVAEFSRVIRSGGTLYISVTKGTGMDLVKDEEENPRKFFKYKNEELAGILTSNGFQVLKNYTSATPSGVEFVEIFSSKL